MNRLIGWLLAIIALAIIVFAVMNYGNYSSICFDEDKPQHDTQAAPAPQTEAPVVDTFPAVDSLNLN